MLQLIMHYKNPLAVRIHESVKELRTPERDDVAKVRDLRVPTALHDAPVDVLIVTDGQHHGGQGEKEKGREVFT